MKDPTRPPTVSSVRRADRALIGLRLKDRYRVLTELGAGAFGDVWLAEDEATGLSIALRCLPCDLAGVLHAVQTKERVARSIVATSTAHPALVHVVEFGDADNGHAFAAMELVEGRRLSEILSAGPLEVDAALRLAIDFGGAVETLHNVGLVHGAVRPHNVMVLEDGRVKLMDVELTGLRDALAMQGLVADETAAEYLSPEEARGAPVTEKTDIYAFGVLLYQMLCGVPPFQAEARESALTKHLTETAAPMRRLPRAVPASAESVVALALSKLPEQRPPMHDILNSLWEEVNGAPARWKRKAAIAGAAAFSASIAVLVGWSLLGPPRSGPRPLMRPTPPPAVEQAPAGAAPTASVPFIETQRVPTVGTLAPTVAPPSAARTTPPLSPAPPAPPRPKAAERREQPRLPQTPARSARDRPSASSDAEDPDPGDVVDWLLERARSRGQ
jgi:protein kinase-like protein